MTSTHTQQVLIALQQSRTGKNGAGSGSFRELSGSRSESQARVLQHIHKGVLMKRTVLTVLMLLAMAAFAVAQLQNPTSDVLGAHLNYGRGCPACHAPHSGAGGNGNAKTADTTAGNVALWGQDVGSLYGQTLQTGQSSHGGPVSETLPTSFNAGTPDVGGLLTCLS